MYRVAVIIPVRNREKLIERALRSVLAQTYPISEIIVVDDGSTDNTASRVADLAKEDARIQFLQHGSSRGAQAARNTGIRAAKSEWIAFLDSDDHWFPHSLQVRVKLAAESGLQVVHTDCSVLIPDSTERGGGGEHGDLAPRLYGVPRMQGNVYKELLRRPGPMFQGLLVSKQAITRVGLLDDAIVSYQEWDTSIRLAKHYEFGFIPEPTFLYDCRYADTISKDALREAKGYEQVIKKHSWPIFRHLAPNALALHYQTAAALYRKGKDEDGVRRCATKAFLLWPFQPRTILTRLQRVMRTGL